MPMISQQMKEYLELAVLCSANLSGPLTTIGKYSAGRREPAAP